MKQLNFTRNNLLGIALLGAFVVAPIAAPNAQAAPPDHAPAYGRRAKNDDNRGRNQSSKKDSYDRDRYDRDSNYRKSYDSNRANDRSSATYSGTVTGVSNGSFDISANGRTYNVYPSSGVPRGLDKGDSVRVSGRPYGDNDIRNASVSVTSNNRGDNGRYDPSGKQGGNSNSYRTYTGVVTKVRSDRNFDVRIGGTTYNVYASSSTRGLSTNDEVRVYGQRYGDNDIRNSNVTITRNR